MKLRIVSDGMGATTRVMAGDELVEGVTEDEAEWERLESVCRDLREALAYLHNVVKNGGGPTVLASALRRAEAALAASSEKPDG